MRVIQVHDADQREACLARLCAEAFGDNAGLTPLLRFAGVTAVLFEQQAARVFALADDDGRPLALALLVLDKDNQGMTPVLMGDLDAAEGESPAMRLLGELARRAPLCMEAGDAAEQTRLESAGITRWFDDSRGRRIGLNARHPATTREEIAPVLGVDDAAVAQNLKQNRPLFDDYKQRFINGLAAFPATL